MLSHLLLSLLEKKKKKLCLINMSFLNQCPEVISEESPEKEYHLEERTCM